MKKEHLIYLAIGTIFWGIIFGFILGIFFVDNVRSVGLVLCFYTLFTAFIVLLVQFYIGGFPLVSPKKCFFIPVAVWFFVFIWGSIEGTLIGAKISLLGLFN